MNQHIYLLSCDWRLQPRNFRVVVLSITIESEGYYAISKVVYSHLAIAIGQIVICHLKVRCWSFAIDYLAVVVGCWTFVCPSLLY